MKKFISILILTLSFETYAEVVYARSTTITQVNAYDDVANVAAYIYLDKSHDDCPNGAYLNPNSPGFDSLYALTLAAFMSNKTVTFQLYNDRKHSDRCEVDAIQVLAN